MNIVFFGTSPFGLPSLETILKSAHTLSAIVTTPDKHTGRFLSLQPSPVKQWAQEKKILLLEASAKNIASLEGELKKIDADVFVVVSFGVILPQSILKIPRLAALNIHSSLLPKYRGPAPIHWAILNGDASTGVTVMRMAPTLDTGDILLQESTSIEPNEEGPALSQRLAVMGALALERSLSLFEKKQEIFKPQENALATYARKITKEDGRIRWNESADMIDARIRALAGWPGTYTFWKGTRILIRQASIAGETISAAPPGQILSASGAEGIQVSSGKGVLRISQLQAEGKKALPASQFLLGTPLKLGDVLE